MLRLIASCVQHPEVFGLGIIVGLVGAPLLKRGAGAGISALKSLKARLF